MANKLLESFLSSPDVSNRMRQYVRGTAHHWVGGPAHPEAFAVETARARDPEAHDAAEQDSQSMRAMLWRQTLARAAHDNMRVRTSSGKLKSPEHDPATCRLCADDRMVGWDRAKGRLSYEAGQFLKAHGVGWNGEPVGVEVAPQVHVPAPRPTMSLDRKLALIRLLIGLRRK